MFPNCVVAATAEDTIQGIQMRRLVWTLATCFVRGLSEMIHSKKKKKKKDLSEAESLATCLPAPLMTKKMKLKTKVKRKIHCQMYLSEMKNALASIRNCGKQERQCAVSAYPPLLPRPIQNGSALELYA